MSRVVPVDHVSEQPESTISGKNGIVRIKSEKITEKSVRDYLFTSQTKLTEPQQNMFIQLATRNNLDPFKREIYAIAYGREFSIVTGYQTYIKRAEESGKLDGWECGADNNHAQVKIYRKDWKHPFIWKTAMKEFNKNIGPWKTMPMFMIKKVCIGQAFRLAFPSEMAGLPYLQEEMEGAKNDYQVIETKKEDQAEPLKVVKEKTQGPTEEELRGRIKTMILNIVDHQRSAMDEFVRNYTTFEGDDGVFVKGVESIDELKGKRLLTTYGRLKKEYPELMKGK